MNRNEGDYSSVVWVRSELDAMIYVRKSIPLPPNNKPEVGNASMRKF